MCAVIVRGAIGLALVCLLGLGARAQNPGDDPDSHGTGLIFDTPEQIASVPATPIHRAFLPVSIDLSDRLPSPGDQGKQSSCVGWAVGYAARSYYAGLDGRDLKDDRNIPSPAYIYNSIVDHTKDCDYGSVITSAFTLLRGRGATSLGLYPYTGLVCAVPPRDIMSRANDFRIEGWATVDTKRPDQVKAQLAQHNPVILGMYASASFLRLKRGEIYRNPGPPIGAHAIVAVGYDERRQAFKLINSWGTNWADDGYGWIDYATFSKVVQYAYVMRVAASPKPPVTPPKPIAPVPGPALECSSVHSETRDGRQVIRGFVSTDEDLARLRSANPAAVLEVTVRPWPQCETLLTLEKNLQRPDAPKVAIRRGGDDTLTAGAALVLEVETPPFPSYLHVAYMQADGSVLNLVQPDTSIRFYPPGSKVTIGEGGSGSRLTVSPPYGREMLVVLAGRSPIFSAPAHSRKPSANSSLPCEKL